MDGEIKQKEYSRLTGLTRKALLIYEQKGILTPLRIDSSTGYRYYGIDEIDRGVKIAVLRSMDFSVLQIEQVINESHKADILIAQKRDELLQKRVLIDQGLLCIDINDSTELFRNTIREIKLPLYQVATIEGSGTTRDLSIHLKLLSRHLRNYGVEQFGPMATYYYPDSTENELHFKVLAPVPGEWLTAPVGFRIENFGAPLFRYLRHYGSYELLYLSYGNLQNAMTKEGYGITGEYLEIYRTPPTPLTLSNTTMLITDIGVPQWF